MKNLLNLTCKTVANMIKDKSPEEVKDIFGIKPGFTASEVCSMQRVFILCVYINI